MTFLDALAHWLLLSFVFKQRFSYIIKQACSHFYSPGLQMNTAFSRHWKQHVKIHYILHFKIHYPTISTSYSINIQNFSFHPHHHVQEKIIMICKTLRFQIHVQSHSKNKQTRFIFCLLLNY